MTSKLLAQAALAAAAVALLLGAIFLISRSTASGGVVEVAMPAPAAPPTIEVYVTGEVANPGVYSLGAAARLHDALAAAGGATADADLDSVNLAARIEDEGHWHVPSIARAAPSSMGDVVPSAAYSSGKLDLNSASARQLEDLPGIGEVRAQAILRFREANGPFSDVDALLQVQGIGPAILDSIRGLAEAR